MANRIDVLPLLLLLRFRRGVVFLSVTFVLFFVLFAAARDHAGSLLRFLSARCAARLWDGALFLFLALTC